MKSFFTLLITICCLLSAFSQTTLSYNINGFPMDSIQSEYIEAETCKVPFTAKVFLDIDYGQESKVIYNKFNRVADEKGNYVEFKSNMDALNYLAALGFELKEADYYRTDDDVNIVKYVLKRRNK
jgi:hypothetical protein